MKAFKVVIYTTHPFQKIKQKKYIIKPQQRNGDDDI